MNFGALPPEVNSGRMYMGAGSGPLMVAASAWDGLAAAMSSAASSYQATILELSGGHWLGASSVSMAAAAFPYVQWMNTTAAQAEATANQARSAAAAYEAAYAATVPPPVIAANRALLMALVATNIFGQNTAAIAAAEAEYGDMWAQDAAAMYGYAGAAATATALPPFSTPAPNTNPARESAQSVAAAASSAQATTSQTLSALSAVPSALGSLAAGSPSFDPVTWLIDLLNSPLGSALNTFSTAVSMPVNSIGNSGSFLAVDAIYFVAPLISAAFPGLAPVVPTVGAVPAGLAASDVSGVTAGATSTLAGSVRGADVSAGLGRAASVGDLAVPQSWGSAAPEIRLAARGLPMADPDALPQAEAVGPAGWFGGMPPIGSVVNAPRVGEGPSTSRGRRKVIPEIATGGSLLASQSDSPTTPTRRDADAELGERERLELNELRQEMADLAMERDAVARLIKEAIRP
ncbi:PPE family protein [Mycobacterium sp. IEC1808]|uniref:PPE family protein n=1 Tax=Mycobacterium sp. IEC1808 TaxID=1743230 RepID=UPI00115232A1|nr:PPE family protein [Mycobacterium sp. IEC1808]